MYITLYDTARAKFYHLVTVFLHHHSFFDVSNRRELSNDLHGNI